MSNCNDCKYKESRCYCPPGRDCTAYVREPKKVSHTFIFETSDDWKPMEAACWGECPFSFNIKLGESCRCMNGEVYVCPFVRLGINDDLVEE